MTIASFFCDFLKFKCNIIKFWVIFQLQVYSFIMVGQPWEYSSMVEHLSSTYKAEGLISYTVKTKVQVIDIIWDGFLQSLWIHLQTLNKNDFGKT